MCQDSPLDALAAQICASAKAISAYCKQTGHVSQSFGQNAPATLLPSDSPPHLLAAQQTLVEASTRIHQLATDPSEYLATQAIHYQQLASLRWLCHFRILSLLPLQDSVAYSKVAAAAGVSESQLKSVARMAMTNNFLCEPIPNELSHNATSASFVVNPNLLDWALFMTEASAPTAAKLVEQTEKYGDTDVKNQTAFNIAMDTDLPFFDYLATSSELTKQFAGYMKNVTASEGTSVKHLLNGFNWASLGKATVVDVGGSSGHASIALAGAFPNLNFIVQDLEDTIAVSNTNLTSLPESISSRIVFQGHNFFDPQPVRNANVYLLRMIIHDWPAAEATQILTHIVKAMKPGARIVIMDTVLPKPGSVPVIQESLLRVRDLTMRQAFNSKEREQEDWIALFKAVDPQLSINGLVQPFRSVMSVMDVVRAVQPPNDISELANMATVEASAQAVKVAAT